MNYERKPVKYKEGEEYNFLTIKHKRSDTNKILTEVTDAAKVKHVILGELPLNKRVRLTVVRVKKSGRLSLKVNDNYLLEKEEEFQVIRVKDTLDKSHKVFELKSRSKVFYTIPLLKWQYSALYKVPKTITCSIYQENERLLIRQVLNDKNKHPVFIKGGAYLFKFLRFDQSAEGRRYLIVIGQDNIEYKVEAQYGQDYSDLKGKKVKCTFVDYNRKGEVYLVQTEKFVITLSKVFKKVENESYFIQQLNKECESSFHFNKFKVQYEQRDNRWLLSLSNSLFNLAEEYINRCLYNEAIQTIELYNEIEQFILTSAFLNSFKEEHRSQIISSGKVALAHFKSLVEPLKLLSKLTYEEFIDNILNEEANKDIEQELKKILLLFKIAPPEYFDKEYKIFQWFNIIGTKKYFTLNKEVTGALFTWLYRRCKVAEKEMLEKIFFNNDEKRKYYKSNKRLIVLINFYIILYNINQSCGLAFNNKIFLSKILRCIILYKNDKKSSSLLSKICLGILYENIEINPKITWSYNEDLDRIENVFHDSNRSHISNLEFIEAKEWLYNKENSFSGEIKSKDRFGYKTLVNNYHGLISSRSIYEYEARFYLKNSKNFHPKFIPLAIDDSSKKVLFEYSRSDSAFFKKKIDFTKINKGDFLPGLVQRHTRSGSVIDLGGISGYVYRREVDWGPVSFVEDFLSLGEVCEFVVTEVMDNNGDKKISLSRKYCFRDPFIHIKKNIGKIYEGRFLRYIDLKYLNEFYRLNVDLTEKGIELVSCPICLNQKGIENKSLVVDKDLKEWHCSYPGCGFHGEEILLFRIDELKVTTAIRIRSLGEGCKELPNNLRRDDLMQMRIMVFEQRNKFVYSEITKVDIKRPKSNVLDCEFNSQDKEVILELARVYEDIASTQKKVKDELNYLHWAQHYYWLSNHAKSYYYNIYISLLDILSELEFFIESNNDKGGIIDKIKSKAVHFINNLQYSDKTHTNYSILENHINILKTLTLFVEECSEVNSNLFEIVYNSDERVHVICKKISKVVLSYNILFNEMSDRSSIDREWAMKLYSVLKEGLLEIKDIKIDLSERLQQDSKKRADEVLLMIHKGEGKNIEFKSSLYTPVLDKKRLAELEKFEKRLEEAKRNGDVKHESDIKKGN